MTYAYSGEENDFLAGRAICWEALQHFTNLQACRESLQANGITTLQALKRLTPGEGKALDA